MKKAIFLLCFVGLMTSISCQKGSDPEWLIPSNKIEDGGPGKDGIPSLDTPLLVPISAIDYLDDDELVTGIKIGNTIRAYPLPILDWHEIINDEFENKEIAIVYCPLTGTGIGWDRMINGQRTTFGVSGLLYNSNIIPYDRTTGSNWSQMLLKSVNGDLIGTKIETYTLLETSWGTWKKMFPDSKVVSNNTGFSRNYDSYPYGSYKTDNKLIFPVTEEDDRRPLKERVLGVLIADQAKVYSFDGFIPAKVITDQFAGKDLVIVGSISDNYLLAFEQTFPELTFEAFTNPDDAAVIMTDNEGNEWNGFGEAVAGPRIGAKLNTVPSFMGYFFSFATFYPGVEIY